MARSLPVESTLPPSRGRQPPGAQTVGLHVISCTPAPRGSQHGSAAAGQPGERAHAGASGAASDDDLLARLAQGEQAVCALLVERHLSRVVSLATRILGEQAEAEDVAQDAFLRLWRHAPSWQPGRAKLSTWLHRVTVNLCIDRKRRKPAVALDSIPEPPSRVPGAASLIAQQQTAKRVQAAIATLPERQRIAILLCHYEGYSNPDTAEMLDTTVEAVESLLARGRRALKQALMSEISELLESI